MRTPRTDPRPLAGLLLVLPGLAACSMDYGVAGIHTGTPALYEALQGPAPAPYMGGTGEADPGDLEGSEEAEGSPQIDVRLDAAFQRNLWGTNVTRCQVQLSFSLPNEAEVDHSQQGHGQVVEIARPEEPGTCAFTEIDPDDIEEHDPGEGGDNWYVSGSLSGPEEIWLVGDTADWVLQLVHAEDGQLRYELPACSVETFPFGQALDLVVPSTEEDLEAFEVTDALAVGSEVLLTSPGPEALDSNGRYRLGEDEDLLLSWESPQGDPVLDSGEVSAPQWELRVQNAEYKGQTYQWLYCMPDAEGTARISGQDLASLHFNAAGDEETVETYLDLHSVTDAPMWETPWGSSLQVRATVSDGGPVYLDPDR